MFIFVKPLSENDPSKLLCPSMYHRCQYCNFPFSEQWPERFYNVMREFGSTKAPRILVHIKNIFDEIHSQAIWIEFCIDAYQPTDKLIF